MGELAALRRVRLESARRKQFLGTDRDQTGEEFITKRRHQLDKWRLTGLLASSG